MKKIYILTAVFALLTLSLNAQTMAKKAVKGSAPTGKVNAPSRATNSVTVGDQTSDTQYLPVYGWWYDGYQQNQMIYTAEQLGNLPAGTKIKSITFYPYNGFKLNGGTIRFSIGTTTASSYSSATAISASDLTQVATITPATNNSLTEWTITFTTDFIYNGGNLLVQTDTESGSDTRSYFYGTQQTNNVCFYSYGYSNPPGNTGRSQILPKATFTYEDASPHIEASPETLTISDSGTNNTFTVEGSNLGTDNVGVTPNNGFSTTTDDQNWGFVNNNGSVSGTVTVTYEGRDLSATGTVTATNNTGASATVSVTYVPDLYIYSDYGASPWDFSANPAIAMTNQGNGIYIATLADLPANSHILFGRASGLTYYWENDGNRLFIGASTDGGDWGYGDNNTGYLDTDPYNDYPVKYHPIYFPEGGTYTITINANDYTFTIEKLVLPPPENVVATPNETNATVTWDAPSNLPTTVTTVTEPVTESFEDQSAVNQWRTIDADGDGHNWVWHDNSSSTSNMITNTGNCVFYSESYYNDTQTPLNPNNWLISPEATLDGTLSLYACGQDSQGYHNEVFGVFVCVGSYNGVSDFVQVGADVTTTHDMTKYTYDLSSYQGQTGHIAIVHHNISDQFILNIDDVTYLVTKTSVVTLNPESYNVYLDGELVGNVPANAEDLTYTFNNLAAGNYTVEISAVYPGDLESEKVPAEFTILERTATPTITVVTNADGSKTISATGDGTVHLYVDGNEVTNPYTIPASPDGDKTYTVTATAQEEGKLISEPAEEIVTVAEGGRTPMPVITIVEHNGYVEITATGDGTVTLTVEGQTVTSETGTGSATIIIVKSTEEQELSITATAQDGDLVESRPATEEYTVPALNTTPTNPASGLLRLHLLMVDQMKQDIPDDNSHPDRYSYILRYEPNGVGGEGTKESGTVKVDIQKADCEVHGYYSLNDIDHDKNIGRNHDQGITMDVVTADVEYDLSDSNEMLYEYLLQGADKRDPEYQKDFLTKLRQTQNFTYVEMWEGSANKGHEFQNGEHHYLDTLKTGNYAVDYRTYAPSVSTWGIQRRYYEDDGYDNTYGAPIWKTSVGKVTMDDSGLKAEKQRNNNNSVNWTTAAGPASLFILDNVVAVGLLPHTDFATVKYEPYMFRIFVESPSGKLRPYQVVPAVPGSATEGEHLDALVPDDELTDAQKYGPISVWDGYIKYDEETGAIIGADPANGVTVGMGADQEYTTQTAYTYTKKKVDRDAGYDGEGNPLGGWDKDSNNAMFGALDAIIPNEGKISAEDLKVFVRFYYVVKGMADGWVPGSRADGDAPAGNGSESVPGSPGPATSVTEIAYHGEVLETIYYNVQGMMSDKPFDGVNIVVNRYSDGATVVSKVVK